MFDFRSSWLDDIRAVGLRDQLADGPRRLAIGRDVIESEFTVEADVDIDLILEPEVAHLRRPDHDDVERGVFGDL